MTTRLADDLINAADASDIVELASRYVALERASGNEWQGPCPRCGGENRFHCKTDGWFCRQCRPIDPNHGWHGAIDFVVWHLGLGFRDAVSFLTGVPLENEMNAQPSLRQFSPVDGSAQKKTRAPQSEEWRVRAAQLVEESREALFSGPDRRGEAYLLGRGLEPHVWMYFSLGYAQHYNPDTRQDEPAIVLPWVSKVGIPAVRFRFLKPVKQKIVSLKGSEFTGLLFGRQGLAGGNEGRRTLVLCEGEINALSIWQVAHETGLDVLSMGSESAKLTPAMIDYAQRFIRVIVWMDKPEIARELQAQIPGAGSISSPEGQDANDLLRKGSLGHYLTAARWQAAQSDDERSLLLWNIWDVANEVQGIDGGTAKAFRKLCEKMGREFDLVEAEPGRWITNHQTWERKHA